MWSFYDDATAEKKSNDMLTEHYAIVSLTHKGRAAIDNRLDAYARMLDYQGVA